MCDMHMQDKVKRSLSRITIDGSEFTAYMQEIFATILVVFIPDRALVDCILLEDFHTKITALHDVGLTVILLETDSMSTLWSMKLH